MTADGSNIRRLTPFSIDAGDPHWSPNGKLILFSTNTPPDPDILPPPGPGKSANLFTMHPDGTHRVALTNYTGGTLALADDWSPDGTQILFSRVALSATNTSSRGLGHIYIMNLTTKHTRRLTDKPTTGYGRAAWGRTPS
jgi:Tol biopolymer transport system component